MALKDRKTEALLEDVRETKQKRRLSKLAPWLYAVVASMAAGSLFIWGENKTSLFQSRFFQTIAQQFSYQLKPPPFAQEYIKAPTGPYNQRFGYQQADMFRDRFNAYGFQMDACTVGTNITYQGLPIFPLYQEKSQAGLTILDRNDYVLDQTRFPEQVFDDFEAIPDFAVQALLYVENRELLQEHHSRQNPAIEWDRFMHAGFEFMLKYMGYTRDVAGGSTLATQLEKVRHSRDGVTYTPQDKLSQMLSASVKVYRDGDETEAERQRIVLDYMNAMPLAARSGFGEVTGLAEGLSVWFGVDLDEAYELFTKDDEELREAEKKQLAVLYRQILSLIMAVQRPSAYLNAEWEYLQNRVDIYIPLLRKEKILSREMAEYVLNARIKPNVSRAPNVSLPTDKSADLVRLGLLPLFNTQSLYDLVRYDGVVQTTIDKDVSSLVTQLLHDFSDPESGVADSLIGYRMADRETMSEIIYSFTLYEKTEDGNVLRLQTDNYEGELNLNEGSKLELGSTAKLRTLITYLEVVEAIYRSSQDNPEFVFNQDPLSLFVQDYIKKNIQTHSIGALLEQAMQRDYSANPYEPFYTGGGRHYFNNFNDHDNHRRVTVKEALYKSINLPFIRMMQDITTYYMHQNEPELEMLLTERSDERRLSYMKEFAHDEGRLFVWRAFNKYRGYSGEDIVSELAKNTKGNLHELVTLYRSVLPQNSYQDMVNFIMPLCVNCDDGEEVLSAYSRYEITKYSLNDRAYLSSTHPLDLWVSQRLVQDPSLSWQDLQKGANEIIEESYEWLFKTNNTRRQNSTIRTVLEKHAFKNIEHHWHALGFPFERMVPSYASALGVSGDQPSALARLVGIIQNDGVSVEPYKYTSIKMALDTPYECHFTYQPQKGERVLSSEIAQIVQTGLQGVVSHGTAIRARNTVRLSDGSVLTVGGKTGTGDNRLKLYDENGTLISDKAQNRTATFVFTIGDRFYGTIVAYVEGEKAEHHSFTSSLPVQAFKEIAPVLNPILESRPATEISLSQAHISLKPL